VTTLHWDENKKKEEDNNRNNSTLLLQTWMMEDAHVSIGDWSVPSLLSERKRDRMPSRLPKRIRKREGEKRKRRREGGGDRKGKRRRAKKSIFTHTHTHTFRCSLNRVHEIPFVLCNLTFSKHGRKGPRSRQMRPKEAKV